ncbi:MAG TPA: hypothetical protein VIU29_03645, partial [Candidatus Deferrimicrobiaceae bacterium]
MRIPVSLKRAACILSLAVLLPAAWAGTARAAEGDIDPVGTDDSPITTSNEVTARLEYFTWHEYSNGKRLLREYGPRLQLGASRTYNRDDITFTPRISGMTDIGEVNYDGHSQDNNGNIGPPLGTDIRYRGLGIGADVGVIYHLVADSRFEPYFGLGWDYWRRDIRSNQFATGYLETWDTIFARGGARGNADMKIGGTVIKGYGELGFKMPLSTQNSARIEGIGKANVHPKGAISFYGSVGAIL